MNQHGFVSTRTVFVELTVLSGVVALALAASCGPDGSENPDDLGEASLAITKVPDDVRCVRIEARGTRTVSHAFTVTPGDRSQLLMSGLPFGEVEFSATAHAESCAAVTSDSEPTWTSDPVTATIVRGVRAQVTLVMRRYGNASIDVNFDDDCVSGPVEIEAPDGTQAMSPVAINEHGQVLFAAYTNSHSQVFLWEEGTLRSLEYPEAFAIALNNRKQVLLTGSGGHAILWESGIGKDLGSLGGATTAGAALNEAGQVVGSSGTASGQAHAFLWDATTGMIDLGSLGGGNGTAQVINDVGTIFGQSWTEDGSMHLVTWVNGTIHDLGTLGGTHAFVYDINTSGTAVGTSAIPGDTTLATAPRPNQQPANPRHVVRSALRPADAWAGAESAPAAAPTRKLRG